MPYIQLQFRRDTYENWRCANPLLASGEMGIELDTHTFKIGDGTLRWNDLPYGGLRGTSCSGAHIPPDRTLGTVLTCIGSGQADIGWRYPDFDPNLAFIKVPVSTQNFNFSDSSYNIYVPPGFGSNYQPLGGGTDTTGFSIIMNSKYNLRNLPAITGTVAYWNDCEIVYMQIKFGNSSTSNSVRARIQPITDIDSIDSSNNYIYCSPLKLTVDGISKSAFSGVKNIGLPSPAPDYAIAIYLKLLN